MCITLQLRHLTIEPKEVFYKFIGIECFFSLFLSFVCLHFSQFIESPFCSVCQAKIRWIVSIVLSFNVERPRKCMQYHLFGSRNEWKIDEKAAVITIQEEHGNFLNWMVYVIVLSIQKLCLYMRWCACARASERARKRVCRYDDIMHVDAKTTPWYPFRI